MIHTRRLIRMLVAIGVSVFALGMTEIASVQTCVPPPSGMVSWWPGDGDANDITGGNHGALQNGATFAPGKVAQAFSVDGVDDYVQFGDIMDGLNGGFTLDAWIQTTAIVGNKAIIAKYWTRGGSWVIRTNESDPRKVDFTVCSPNCETLADAVQLVSTSNINDGAWHFIAATFDGTTQRLYVDGELEASGTNTNPAWTDNHHFCIGSFCDPSGNSFLTFGGLIDEPEIFNRALSAAEVATLFNAGSAGKCKPGANNAPGASCQIVTVAAGANCTAEASINNGSFDPDGDAITVTQSPAGPYSLGTTDVTLTVTDSNGASSQCMATVTVVDSTAPTITGVSANPSVLWPPNHQMVDVMVNYNVTDNCSSSSASTCSLSVSSNEPVNGTGDGDTAPDWEIVDAHHVRLRAERAGGGNGRIYTITIQCTDSAGNSFSQNGMVSVPKSKK